MTLPRHETVEVPVTSPEPPDDWDFLYDDDMDDGDCWNCDGEGYIWDCFDGFCLNAQDGCKLCTRRCPVCNPKRDPAADPVRNTGDGEGG